MVWFLGLFVSCGCYCLRVGGILLCWVYCYVVLVYGYSVGLVVVVCLFSVNSVGCGDCLLCCVCCVFDCVGLMVLVVCSMVGLLVRWFWLFVVCLTDAYLLGLCLLCC